MMNTMTAVQIHQYGTNYFSMVERAEVRAKHCTDHFVIKTEMFPFKSD